MKAFIKVRADIQAFILEVFHWRLNEWNWVAPTCMNVVKLTVCFLCFFYLLTYLFAYPLSKFSSSKNVFQNLGFGTKIMDSCIITFLSSTDQQKYRLLYILYCILFTMVLYKKYIHIRSIWHNAFIVHPIFCGNCNVWLNLLTILKWICDLLCMVSV